MPYRRLANDAGVYRPEEIAMLGRVFDELIEPDMDTKQREALASRIIGYYMAGIKGEDELIALSKQPIRR